LGKHPLNSPHFGEGTLGKQNQGREKNKESQCLSLLWADSDSIISSLTVSR
jgi:hypothetical protein